jgi:hypothetical protein
MEVMDLDDDKDERRDDGEGLESFDKVRGDGRRTSQILIVKSTPSESQDSQPELHISESTGNKGDQSILLNPVSRRHRRKGTHLFLSSFPLVLHHHQ